MLDRSSLHDYQQETIDALVHRMEMIAVLDMGAGKTISTLTAFCDLQDSGKVQRLYVWAPKRIAQTVWAQEAAAWAHTANLTVSVVLGTPKQRKAALERDADVYVQTYDNLDGDAALIKAPSWSDMVVLDEVTRLKGVKSKRGKTLRRLIAQARRVVGLTGTPQPKDRQDLFMQVLTVDRGKTWGTSFYKWRQQNFMPLDWQGYDWGPQPGKAPLLDQQFAGLCFRVEPHKRPQPTVVDHWVTLPADALKVHRLALEELVLAAGGPDEAIKNAAVATGKARQIASGTLISAEGVEVVHTAKFDALDDILEDAGEPVLVLYGYVEERAELKRRYPHAEVLDDDRTINDVMARWNRGEVPLLIGHPASMGHGLNLQAGGRRVVWLTLPWSLELYAQAIARLDRQGQTRQVYVHRLMAEETLDAAVVARLAGRDAEQKALMARMLKQAQAA